MTEYDTVPIARGACATWTDPAAPTTRLPRVAALCGSIRPLRSGTDDYAEILHATLCERGAEVRVVDLGRWGVRAVPALLRAVAAMRPDVVLMQYPTDAFGRSPGPPLLGLLQRAAPLVVTLHEFTLAHPLRRLSVGALLVRAARVVVTAEREAEGLARAYPWLRGRIRTVPIAANIPPRRWAPTSVPEVVHFGQIRPGKGIEILLACRDRIAQLVPGAVFRVIGSAPPHCADYAARLMAEMAGRGIRLQTELAPEAVADALAGASLALLPFPDGASLRRGSLLAAAVCGTPIASLCGPDTSPALAATLDLAASEDALVEQAVACLADPTARQRAHRQSEELGRSLRWDAIADRYLEILEEVTA